MGKKVIVIVGAIILLIFIVLSFFIFSKKNNPASTVVIPTIEPVNLLQNPGSVLSYDGSFMSALFPRGWEVVPGVFKGGEEAAFRPKGLPAGDFIPSVYVIKFSPGTPELLASQRALFDKLGFKESVAKIGGISGIMLSGKEPFYTKNGQVVNQPLQETVYFLQSNGALTEIRLRYPGQSVDENTQAVFSYILNSIQFK